MIALFTKSKICHDLQGTINIIDFLRFKSYARATFAFVCIKSAAIIAKMEISTDEQQKCPFCNSPVNFQRNCTSSANTEILRNKPGIKL